MSGVLSRLALRSRLLKGLVSGVGLAFALAIGSPLLAGIGVTLPTLGSALATCPTTGIASSTAYGPTYATGTGTITVTFSATTGTTGCQMVYHILATGGLTTSWGDYHYDDYNPAFGAPNPPSRYPSGVAFNIRPAAQGVVHWYYNYRECALHTVPDKSWVASIFFAVSVDNGPCSGQDNIGSNWVFDDHTVIYDTVAPVSTTAGGAPTYSASRSVGVTYLSTSDATSGVASVSVYRTLSATPSTADALCGTDTTPSPPTVITCATTADGLWHFYSRATDKAGNVEPLPTAADDTTIVDTVPPAAPNGTLTAQAYATQAAVNGIVYFNGNVGTSFTITSDGTDSSGIASNTFSAPAATTGWTTTTAATVAGDPSARAYTWTSAAVATSITLKSTDNATNIGAIRTITLTDDSTAPAIAISAPATDTQNTLTSPAFTFTLSDAASGVDAARSYWRRSYTTLAANVCGTTWTDEALTLVSTGGSPAQAAMVNGRCYRWLVDAYDNVNNRYYVYSNTIKVDTEIPVFNGFTVPSASTTYTSATSATFTWNAGTDTLSGVYGYHRVLQSAPITSPGVCGAFANLSDHGISAPLTITESGLANGTCYQEAVRVEDNAGNYSGWTSSHPYLIDTVDPVFNGFTVPSASTTYTSATSATFTWNAGTDTLSGFDHYHLVLQSAPVTSPGVCGAWTNLRGVDPSSALTITESGLANGTCYKEAVDVFDRAGNDAGWPSSNPYLIDTLPPPTTISTSTPCVSPGGQATFTVARTDPSPSSNWLTSANASTSWWSETFDGPWTGAYRLDPWPGNTNASATFNIGYPAPTVGTQAAYTRVVWTRDNAGNTTDSTVPLAQGRGTGVDVTVDNTAPNGAWISGPAYTTSPTANFTFNANAGGCAGIDSVSISNDNGVWTGLGNVRSVNGWDFTTGGGSANANQGAHTVRISFHEKGTGNWNEATFTFIYDTVPPTVTTTLSVGTVAYTNSTSITSTYSATDSTSGVHNWNHYQQQYPSTDGNGNCTGTLTGWTLLAGAQGPVSGGTYVNSGLTNGTCYQWATNAGDEAGNHSYQSNGEGGAAPTQWVMIDTTPPVFTGFTVPSASTTYTTATSAIFAWNAGTDNVSGVNGYHRVLQSAPITSPGVCGTFTDLIDHGVTAALTITESGLTSGTCYKEAVRVVDRAVNYSAWYGSNPYLVDTAPPSIAFTAPTGTAWIRSTTQAVAWNETATPSGIRDRSIYIQVAPITAGICGTYSQATGMFGGSPQTFTGLGEGYCYGWAGWITSNAGVTGSSGGMTSGIVKVDLTAPTGSLIVPAYSTSRTVAIPFVSGDSGSGVVSTQIGYWSGGTGWVSCGSAAGTSGSISCTVPTDGSFMIDELVTDAAGNTYGWYPIAGARYTVVVDTVAPTHNGHTFSGGSNWFATGTALNPTVYVNTNVAGSVVVTAQVSDTGSGVKNVSFANPSGQAGWTYPQGVVPSPPYQITVSWNAGAAIWAGTPNSQAIDWAGNLSVWQGWTFINDTSPPVITWTNPTADVYDTTGSVTPSWVVADAGAGIGSVGTVKRFYLPTLSANVCSGTPVDDGPQTSGTPTTLISGRCYYWAFTIQPTDNVGNATVTNRTSATIKVDTVHPTGTLIFDDTLGVTHSRFINASVTMADANSGPLQVRFSTDGGFSWTAWTAYVVGTPTVTPLTLASGTGTYTVLAQIQDLAGNMTPLGHSTALLNAVIEPTLGAAAKIYDCATGTLLATNTTGTIYWSVDRTLCLVPTARLVTPGSDGTNNPTLVGTIAAPSGTPGNYILHDPDQTWTLVGGTWPTPFVGATRTAADTPLRFTFGRETSSLSTSTPYLTIPYDTQAVVGWYNGATLVRSETVTVTLNLRVVVKNSGTTGTN